ncbi:adenylosuccinate synthase [Candidatus Bipolaricaulota bacterium]|nr:adenylosuccinate synthase [Candidatus Bipolaricaulota bacterium]
MATAVLGMQWGDEGKGKITHLLAKQADMVVRFNGGPNAGHTMIDRGVKFGTHQIPAGAFYSDTCCVLASGMVVDMWVLREEYEAISNHLGREPQLLISETAHLILPYHRILEELEGSGARIGTTRRGIGTAYRDKAARVGIRAGDLLHPQRLCDKLSHRLDLLKRMWPASSEIASLSAESLSETLLAASQPFLESITDASAAIRLALKEGKQVIFEGAQGALLDLDFGTYPYVTSSSTTLAGLGNAIGIPFPQVEQRIGVVKAYTTRVGEGPFPTELADEEGGKQLREQGGEFGVTTGRPRRCGWLDLVALRHAAALNDPTRLGITKLDVLSGMAEIKVCRAYRLRGSKITDFPHGRGEELALCEPIYETFSGWDEEIRNVRKLEELPQAARDYLEVVTQEVGVPIGLVSVGPAPEETIVPGFDSHEGACYNHALDQ